MKMTLDIPHATVEAFRLLERINGIPWKEMLQQEITNIRFFPADNEREVAFKAMEFCQSDEQAEAVLERAYAYANRDGSASVPRVGLYLNYEEAQGKIDPDERDILAAAARIMESGN